MIDNRDLITALFDAATVNGVAYLFAIIALGSATVQELADLSNEHDQTVRRYLKRLESRGFVIRVQDGRADRFHPAPKALKLSPAHLLTKFSYVGPSSSSDLIRDRSDQSDQSSEEEEGNLRKKRYLVRQYNLTGEKAAALLADPWVTPLRLVAWMQQVGEMKRNKFPFTKSPEAYAIRCLLRHDDPNRAAYHLAPAALDQYIRQLDLIESYTDDEDDEDTEEGTDHDDQNH